MTRFGYAATAYLAALGFAVLAVIAPGPKLIWNVSASVPVGLYVLHPAGTLHVGDLVAIRTPEPLARFLDGRRYLPIGAPMLKHVAALPGQKVCRDGRNVTVDGRVVAVALDRDRAGRALPVWQGCGVITAGAVFLLNARWDSLDGRYFGLLPVTTVMGRAEVWAHGSGHSARPQHSAKAPAR